MWYKWGRKSIECHTSIRNVQMALMLHLIDSFIRSMIHSFDDWFDSIHSTIDWWIDWWFDDDWWRLIHLFCRKIISGRSLVGVGHNSRTIEVVLIEVTTVILWLVRRVRSRSWLKNQNLLSSSFKCKSQSEANKSNQWFSILRNQSRITKSDDYILRTVHCTRSVQKRG